MKAMFNLFPTRNTTNQFNSLPLYNYIVIIRILRKWFVALMAHCQAHHCELAALANPKLLVHSFKNCAIVLQSIDIPRVFRENQSCQPLNQIRVKVSHSFQIWEHFPTDWPTPLTYVKSTLIFCKISLKPLEDIERARFSQLWAKDIFMSHMNFFLKVPSLGAISKKP